MLLSLFGQKWQEDYLVLIIHTILLAWNLSDPTMEALLCEESTTKIGKGSKTVDINYTFYTADTIPFDSDKIIDRDNLDYDFIT